MNTTASKGAGFLNLSALKTDLFPPDSTFHRCSMAMIQEKSDWEREKGKAGV
jgi:hypothetical protein